MREYHPTDSRYRPPAGQTQRATPLRSYLAEREAAPLDLTDERTLRKQERAAGQAAADAVFKKTPFWVQFIPFATQIVQIKSENARNAAAGKSWGYTIAQLVGALLLYLLLFGVFDMGVIAI